jgi:HEAT repeat protein
MREVLQARASGKCVNEWVFSEGGSSSEVSILIKLMLTDEDVAVRLQAADTLGWVGVDRKAIMDALRDKLGQERNAAVVMARIHSIRSQLNNNWYGNRDESIRLDEVLNSLAMPFERSSRTASENEAILATVGWVANDLIGAPYTRPGKLDEYHAEALTRSIANLVHGFMAIVPEQAAPTSAWRADILSNLESSLRNGYVVFEPKVHVPMLLSVAKRVDDPFPKVRAASLRLMVQAFDLLERQADQAWQDYDPYLTSSQIEQLAQKAAVATGDKDAAVRAAAVALLGRLTPRSNSQDTTLVAALSDPWIGVRKEAALSLARKSSMPQQAVSRLVEMARQVDEDSPHAIAALSTAADAEVQAKEAPPPEPVPSWQPVPERWLSPRALAKARTEAAARALDKFGGRVLLSLLKRAPQAGTENARARMYSVMVGAGWPSAAPGMQLTEAALTPAILGENEDSRVFALSLLAAQPIEGTYRYSASLVDAMFKRYLQDKPVKMSKEAANPSTFMMVGGDPLPPHWNTGWRMKPQFASSVIASGSNSKFAAERMVAYICAGHRLILGESGGLIATWGGSPLSDELDITSAMQASLDGMGEIARPYVERALAKKHATLLCRRTLDKNFEPPEE